MSLHTNREELASGRVQHLQRDAIVAIAVNLAEIADRLDQLAQLCVCVCVCVCEWKRREYANWKQTFNSHFFIRKCAL